MSNGSFRVSRRFVMAGLLAGVAEGAFAEPLAHSLRPRPRPTIGQTPAAPSADSLIAQAQLSGRIGFVVADAHTGQVLEALNPLLPLPPASTAKAITTLYALQHLGPGFRFRTQAVATGPVTGGRVQGDLVLVGGGDPVLTTDDLGDLAASLKAAGVREVAGRFRYYDGALPALRAIDPAQPEHVGYNPAISGLNLNFNRVHFEWRRGTAGWDVTMDARAQRYRPRVNVARMRVVNRQIPVYTYSETKGVDNWTVASGALGKDGSRWLPVRNPGAYTAEVFQTLARSHGIALPRAEPASTAPQGTALATHDSPELQTILQGMLKYSTNLTAEAVGMTATRARGLHPASLSASAGAMETWLATVLNGGTADFRDHSGLGPRSRISASEMTRALVRFGPGGPLKGLMKDVPMRDAQGKAVKGHPAKIRAKTGTLNFVSALTGYVTAADGTELAFTIFMADEERRAALSRDQFERPEGGRTWIRRAHLLQGRLIDRWATLYGA
ncbi:D-alanyl-D-alanine carboxypeptidase/D-alanyl-D-alanine endopeptidase [Actibacterium sp. D379-3]